MCDIEVDRSLERPLGTQIRTRRALAADFDSVPDGVEGSSGTSGGTSEAEESVSATRAGDVIGTLVSFVPAEAIAAYLVLLPFMAGGDDSTGRWFLALGVGVLAVVYAIGYRKIAAVQAQAEFRVPWIPIFTTIFAFTFWVFAIPNSPFGEFSFYSPELGGAVGVIAATLISFVGAVTGETLAADAAENA